MTIYEIITTAGSAGFIFFLIKYIPKIGKCIWNPIRIIFRYHFEAASWSERLQEFKESIFDRMDANFVSLRESIDKIMVDINDVSDITKSHDNSIREIREFIAKKRSKCGLIVDDEPEMVEIISLNAQELGYSCYTAMNGKQALELLKMHGEDISFAFVDNNLNNCMEGVDVLREIANGNILKSKQGEIKAVLYTGGGDIKNIPEGVTIMYKPISGETIRAAIERMNTI
jgi:CheY-like chemotaxis protein